MDRVSAVRSAKLPDPPVFIKTELGSPDCSNPTATHHGTVCNLAISVRGQELLATLRDFCHQEALPAERVFEEQHRTMPSRWQSPPIMEELKASARAKGLWNLFLPKDYPEGAGLTNLEYAYMAEVMGCFGLASEATNCSAPDTGNMEVLAKYGTVEQKKRWLQPLLDGTARSVFMMTEPEVASSDATNIQLSLVRDGDYYVANGRKWWSSGGMDTRCKIVILMGKSNPNEAKHKQQSMFVIPMDLPGMKVLRSLNVFGYDDAPHGHAEILFENVRIPSENLILGEGRGFEIAQGRLGPGRIHHCMRTIGVAERALQTMVQRSLTRKAFGKVLAAQGTIQLDIALSRIEINQARLLVLNAAARIDQYGVKGAIQDIAMIKVIVPRMALQVIDRAIQVHGGAGVSQDTFLARAYAGIRSLRIADGPDVVHERSIALLEIGSQAKRIAKL
eukprot:GEMP01025419.1.p1 GENE.GEMP01025419.1~~GEMP01025419.1.p1  ORF type:complete len:448 (-),score=96.95 GEMP01025419.1:34-1377(-)